jgi:formate hydrogenlyase subunit 6/NADH:ubiquinone oxidoreductase subunit I
MVSWLRAARAAESVKSFLFPPTQVVADYPSGGKTGAGGPSEVRVGLVGLRACELRAVQYLDQVFGNPPIADPFYQEQRRRHVLVSVDCVQPHDTCFCHLVDGKPYADTGFDVNLTPIDGAFVLEAASQAGNDLLKNAGAVLREASEQDLQQREQARQGALKRLKELNRTYEAGPGLRMAAEAEDSGAWDRHGATCVECGACTQICPTCHCFYLFDRAADADRFRRLRAWDSCTWSGYSRMAGAERMKPNPRSQFRSRFANRFLHKYVWSPQQWQMLGCVGCGRCVEACPGRIDIRKVIAEVSA